MSCAPPPNIESLMGPPQSQSYSVVPETLKHSSDVRVLSTEANELVIVLKDKKVPLRLEKQHE